MNKTDKTKLVAAGAIFGVALAIIVAYTVFSGGGGPSDADIAAQQKILESMPAQETPPASPEPEAPTEPPPAGAASEPPAGRPRSVRPGT